MYLVDYQAVYIDLSSYWQTYFVRDVKVCLSEKCNFVMEMTFSAKFRRASGALCTVRTHVS